MSRGRNALAPIAIPPKGWLDIFARVAGRLGTVPVGLLAAGVAFYGVLSLFPAITAGVALVGIFYDPTELLAESQWLLGLLPVAAAELIAEQMKEVANAGQGSLGLAALVSLGIALWSSSNATGSLVQGLNLIYEEDEERNFLAVRALVILLTVLLILGLSLTLVIVSAVPSALAFLGVEGGVAGAVEILRWPLVFVVSAGGIAVLYRYGPDRTNARWRWLTPGAALACALWVVGTWAFAFYVRSFGSYNETFGALAGVIILLTWLWLSAFVVLLGAALDAEIEAQTGRDSTVGPRRPMGQRGAVKADKLGAARDAGG